MVITPACLVGYKGSIPLRVAKEIICLQVSIMVVGLLRTESLAMSIGIPAVPEYLFADALDLFY